MKGEDGKVAVENVSSEEQEEQFKQSKKNDEYFNKVNQGYNNLKVKETQGLVYIFLFQR